MEACVNKRKTGSDWELNAAAYLSGQGMEIMERNFRCRQGEIDLIGYHNGYLVFVEVKYRKSSQKGTPEAAVGYIKQKKICRVADYYRYRHRMNAFTAVRYDVLAIRDGEFTWHQNAFSHIYANQ